VTRPAALLVLAAVVAAVALVTTRDGDPVLENALDAVGDGPVLHAVARERIAGGQRFDVETLRTRPVVAVYETWVDAERNHVHAVERSGKEVVSDELTDLDEFGTAEATAALAVEYRRRLEDEELRVARSGALGGRKVHWLASTTERAGVPPFEAAVDAETHRLLRIRTIAKYLQTTRDFELLESLAREDADFTARFGAPAAVRQARPEGRRVAPRIAARELRGAHWAGRRVGDLPLRDIRAADWRAALRPGGDVRGLLLTVGYGERLGAVIDPEAGTPNGIEIVQAADDGEARWFLRPRPLPAAPPPTGSFDVSGEFNRSGQFVVASLRKPGVWILVRAPTRRLLFEAVRALRPIS
jgi:hypothetical protein